MSSPTTLSRVVKNGQDKYWFEVQGDQVLGVRPYPHEENLMTGVAFRFGGYWSAVGRPPIGYKIQHDDHWVFAGTGMKNGEMLGEDFYLVGMECDGVPTQPQPPGSNAPLAVRDEWLPPNFIILGYAYLTPIGDGATGWLPYPNEYDGKLGRSPPPIATMGIYTAGGTVFTAGTTDWVRTFTGDKYLGKDEKGADIYVHEKDKNVEQITRNVLDRLRSHGKSKPEKPPNPKTKPRKFPPVKPQKK